MSASLRIKHKRSSVSGKKPTISDIELGEIAVNTADGRLHISTSLNGVSSIKTFVNEDDINILLANKITDVTTTTYQQEASYTHIHYNTIDNNITTTLLSPSAISHTVTHKKTNSNNIVTLIAPGDATIEGSVSISLSSQYETVKLYSDGSNYFLE